MKNHPKKSTLFLTGLCALCIAVLIFQRLSPGGTTAIVECGGEVVLRRELSDLSGVETVNITGKNGISLVIELSPDGAAVLSSQCPDKVCVHTGKLTRAGETAICLPAQVVLRLEGDSGVDGKI